MLSLDVKLISDRRAKAFRAYFVWEYKKVPEVVVEVVSNREGGEDSDKLEIYAQIGVRYYAIYDPEYHLSEEALRTYRLQGTSYVRMNEPIWFPEVGLGLGLWEGQIEDMPSVWLRWVDAQGVPIPTAEERVDAEAARAEAAVERARKLAEKLRQLGIEPNGE